VTIKNKIRKKTEFNCTTFLDKSEQQAQKQQQHPQSAVIKQNNAQQ